LPDANRKFLYVARFQFDQLPSGLWAEGPARHCRGLDLPVFDSSAVPFLLLDPETVLVALDRRPPPLSQVAYLGAAVLLLTLEEARMLTTKADLRLGTLRHLAPYPVLCIVMPRTGGSWCRA